MKIITRRNIVTEISYMRSFEWKDDPGAGFMFICDEHGHLSAESLNPDAEANLMKCLDGTFAVIDCGVEKREFDRIIPAVGRCTCGQVVTLDSFTNTCTCGADYNMSGQQLADRSQWGEETGESLDEILRIR